MVSSLPVCLALLLQLLLSLYVGLLLLLRPLQKGEWVIRLAFLFRHVIFLFFVIVEKVIFNITKSVTSIASVTSHHIVKVVKVIAELYGFLRLSLGSLLADLALLGLLLCLFLHQNLLGAGVLVVILY